MDKKKPLMQGAPPRYPVTLSPLCTYPSPYPYETPLAYASPYSYAGAISRHTTPSYFQNPPFRHPLYPYPAYHPPYIPFQSVHRGLVNFHGGRPLLTNPPPLMPPPPILQHYVPVNSPLHRPPQMVRGSPVQYQPRMPSNYQQLPLKQPPPYQTPASRDVVEPPQKPEAQSVSTQNSPTKSSSSHSPFEPFECVSHPELIKSFKFLEDPDSMGEMKGGEMLIRGFIFEYDSSGAVGYLTSGSNMKVEVNKDVMYIMGRKIGSHEDFWDVLALGANIKAIIIETSMDNEKEDVTKKLEVKYRAVIAWFGEIPSIKDLMPVILQFKNATEPKEVDSVSNNVSKATCKVKEEDNSDSEGDRTSSTVLSHILGYIWWANKEHGIMRIYETKGWGPEFSGIFFKADSLHFEGQRTNCEMLHFLVAHLNKCDVQARKIESKIIHGMLIKWEAVHVECGPLPRSLISNVPHSMRLSVTPNSDTSGSSNYESFPDDSDDDTNLIPTSVVFNQTKNSFDNARKDLGSKNYDDMNAQKNVFGNVQTKLSLGVEKESNSSSEKREKERSEGRKSKEEKDIYMIKDLSISYATADINSLENEADLNDLFHDEYSGKHLTGHIIKLFPTSVGTGIAQWKSMDYGSVYIIFKQSDMFVDLIPINKLMQLPPSVYDRRCNLYVLPIKHQDRFGYRVKVVATCGWLGTKPLRIPTPGEQPKSKISLGHLDIDLTFANASVCEAEIAKQPSSKDSHLSYSYTNGIKDTSEWNTVNRLFLKKNVKEKLGSNLKTFSEDSSVVEGCNEEVDGYHTGEVVEVHCKMGKIMSEDGTNYYFSREQCFLYGVSLCEVELWHVLVHGQKILFSLNKNTKNQAKVDEVVIGWKGSCPAKSCEVERYIKEWCTNNAVPDAAKNILMKQLKKS